jgi:hypothetical protein
MSDKPKAYFTKKDRYGKSKVHPIFASQPSRREPRAKTYRVEQKNNVVTVTRPSGHSVELKMTSVDPNELVATKPSGYLGDRIIHFVELLKRGEKIPPIVIHKREDGKYEILDGHARVAAYKRLKIRHIPAVENENITTRKSLLQVLEEEDRQIARKSKLAQEKQMTRDSLVDLVFEAMSSDQITRALAKTEIERRFPAEYRHLFEEEPGAATPSAIVEAPTATGMSYVQRPSGVTKFARFVEERYQKAEERKKARKEAELSETERRTGIRKTRAEIEKLEAETRKEMAEHPQLKKKEARKIAAQHMIPEEISLRKATMQVPKPKPLPALSGDKRDTSL